VRNKESGFDVAVVGVLSSSVEDLLVQVDVVVVDCVVEGDGDHLRNVVAFFIGGTKISRYFSPVFGAEAIGQFANGVVTQRRPIRICVDVAGVFVGSVVAVGNSVTEQTCLDAVAISAGEMVFLADGFVGGQQRFHFFFFGQLIAVCHHLFPITSLFFQIKCKSWWAADRLEPSRGTLDHISAIICASF
jgi:hypothetical protein